MNFREMMEAPPEGHQTFTHDQDLLHGHAYTPQTPDVHFTRGLACIDCHTEKELHGDGFEVAISLIGGERRPEPELYVTASCRSH
jgi:hypothetical protein